MSIFRFKADRLPVAIFIGFFTLDLLVYFLVENHWLVIAWFMLSIWPKGNICAWNHHHQHCLTFRSSFLNRCLEIVYGFQTGLTSKAWFLHHVLGHHLNYLDQSKDESRWMDAQGNTMSAVRYTFEVGATSFHRAFKVGLRYPRHLRDFLLMFGLQIIILGLLTWYNWFNALFLFLVPMIFGLLITAWATYDHHAGLDTKDEYEGSRNVMNKAYNLLTGNLGYHTAHHIKQGLHWSRLPQFHQEIRHRIPDSCYYEPGIPYSWYRGGKKAAKWVVRPFGLLTEKLS